VILTTTGHRGARYLELPPEGPFDEALLRVFPSLDGLRFIQIGANDGVRTDPIHKYITRCGWTGVLVEPLPALFSALQSNYAGHHARLTFLNAAVDATSGERALFEIMPDTPELVDWARGTMSFDRAHVLRVARQLMLPETVIRSTTVRTITWAEVLAALRPQGCDVLVIDAEGYDVTLLRLANLARLKPAVIQFEHEALERRARLDFYGELIDLGYEIATSFSDTIAYLPPHRQLA